LFKNSKFTIITIFLFLLFSLSYFIDTVGQ
jgi:hypothetical protein